MRVSSTSCVTLALVLSPVVACGPGRLPDPNFGSAGEDTGETATADSSAEPGDGDGPSSSASTSWGESVGEETPGDGDGDSSTTDGPGTSTTTASTGDGDGDGDPDGDGDWGDGDGDWGNPPDVTNEPCEPLLQDCFPSHKCVPFASQPGSSFMDANKCMPILGDKQWGEPCTLSSYNESQDDCDGEGFCWNLEWEQGQLHGTCVPFCTGTPQDLTCPIGWGCLFSGALALCPKQCDPLLQDCPVDYGCYWVGGHFQCLLVATPADINESCEKIADCLPGLGCVDGVLMPECVGDDPGCCTAWCDVDEPACPGALECVPFFDEGEVPDWLAHVGICITA